MNSKQDKKFCQSYQLELIEPITIPGNSFKSLMHFCMQGYERFINIKSTFNYFISLQLLPSYLLFAMKETASRPCIFFINKNHLFNA